MYEVTSRHLNITKYKNYVLLLYKDNQKIVEIALKNKRIFKNIYIFTDLSTINY